jgi:NAD dependent epimerase/dehydratase family enzyme
VSQPLGYHSKAGESVQRQRYATRRADQRLCRRLLRRSRGSCGDEDEPPHNEFTHKLCARWEQLACEAQSDRTRVCLLRTGVVLAPTGGILAKMMPLFRLGLGGPIGNGRQYLAWIHIDDMVNGILWLLDNDLSGPFNMVSLIRSAMNSLPILSGMR